MTDIRKINDVGIGLRGDVGHRLHDLRVIEEAGRVQMWIEVEPLGRDRDRSIEVLQYLTPGQAMQAMAFAKAFERCAIEALKNSA